jgi:hypothetical protein
MRRTLNKHSGNEAYSKSIPPVRSVVRTELGEYGEPNTNAIGITRSVVFAEAVFWKD